VRSLIAARVVEKTPVATERLLIKLDWEIPSYFPCVG